MMTESEKNKVLKFLNQNPTVKKRLFYSSSDTQLLSKLQETTILTFEEYQQKALRTCNVDGDRILHAAFGLLAESGEIAKLFQKYQRGDMTWAELMEKIPGEIGDVLWYVSDLCSQLELVLSDVATGNIEKLADRLSRGKIRGNGDER
ncbi:MAG: nucleoside triphosphate pyrophosphohydrolase family protein [Wenzhouxiangella sp.]|nr:nucleoside triphosphate pyrophosphohydrolase family protein [Wenzhouxiangella sp.]